MLRGIMGEVGQQGEVAVAVVEFQLGSGVVIGIQIEICHEEALYVAFAIYTVVYRRYRLLLNLFSVPSLKGFVLLHIFTVSILQVCSLENLS